MMQRDMTSPTDRCIWHGAMRSIQNLVCEEFNISYIDLLSPRRDKKFVRPRHLAMWLCRTMTMASFPQIGRAFYNRDHTTIMHAVKKVEGLLKEDTHFSKHVNELLEDLING